MVNKELLEVHQTQLMEKDATGLHTLLQDDKKHGAAHNPMRAALLMEINSQNCQGCINCTAFCQLDCCHWMTRVTD